MWIRGISQLPSMRCLKQIEPGGEFAETFAVTLYQLYAPSPHLGRRDGLLPAFYRTQGL